MDISSKDTRAVDQVASFRDVIDLWPSRLAFADDLGVAVDRVHKWAQIGGVRAEFFAAILDSAERRGLHVTAADLCRIASKKNGRVA